MPRIVRSTNDAAIRLLVDDDGRYSVTVLEKVTFQSRVLSAAEIVYSEEVEKHRPTRRDLLARERAEFDARAMKSEADSRKSARANRSGGKGGRGGV